MKGLLARIVREKRVFVVPLALALHVLAFTVQQPRVSMVALAGGAWCLVALVWGPGWARKTFFPFLLLGFCVPLEALGEGLLFRLRLLVTQISVGLGHDLLGLDVMREGTRIFNAARTFNYDVAPACSGIRSLTSLLAVTTIYGYVTFLTPWKRAAMMVLAAPLAVAGNVARITTVIILAEAFGHKTGAAAETNLGYVTFAVAIGLMFLAGWLMRDREAPLATPTGLPDAQLAALQARLQTNVLLPGVLRSLEVERADMDQVFLSIRSGGETLKSAFGSGATGWDRVGEQAGAMGWRIFLSEADELFYLRNMQGQIDALRLLLRQRDWSGVQTNLAAVRAELLIFDTWRGNLLLVSSMAIPNLSKAMLNSVRHEARRELTLAAVALERHRRRHGHHPATLSQLVPEFLPAMPVDWMDGKPLRYRLNPDGTYTLWSVGEDFKDDGGDGTEAKPPTVGSQPDIWNGRDALWPRLPAGTPVP